MARQSNNPSGIEAVEGVRLATLARKYGTPLYIYSYSTLIENFRSFRDGFAGLDPLIAYSMKCNSNGAVLRALFGEGAGLDVVSMGMLSEDDLDARGITKWSGVAYEILFTVGRGVTRTDWEQAAAPEATVGPGGVGIETEAEILPTNAPGGTLPVDVC